MSSISSKFYKGGSTSGDVPEETASASQAHAKSKYCGWRDHHVIIIIIITWWSLSRDADYHHVIIIITWSSSSDHHYYHVIITWSSLSRDHHYHVIIKKRKCSWQFFFNSHYRKFLCLLFSFSLGTANQDRHTRNTATAVANHAPEREEEANSNSDYEGDEWGEEGWQEDEWSNERVSRYIHCWHNITLDIRFLYFT